MVAHLLTVLLTLQPHPEYSQTGHYPAGYIDYSGYARWTSVSTLDSTQRRVAELLRAGNWRTAKPMIQTALAKNPSDPFWCRMLVDQGRLEGNLDPALKHLQATRGAILNGRAKKPNEEFGLVIQTALRIAFIHDSEKKPVLRYPAENIYKVRLLTMDLEDSLNSSTRVGRLMVLGIQRHGMELRSLRQNALNWFRESPREWAFALYGAHGFDGATNTLREGKWTRVPVDFKERDRLLREAKLIAPSASPVVYSEGMFIAPHEPRLGRALLVKYLAMEDSIPARRQSARDMIANIDRGVFKKP